MMPQIDPSDNAQSNNQILKAGTKNLALLPSTINEACDDQHQE